MALLEKINSMKQSGMNDLQIINALKEEGITPREINEALSQLKIKSAIASPQQEEMQPSIMAAPQEQMQQYSEPQYTTQNTQEQYNPQYSPEQYSQAYAPQEQQYYSQTLDVETVRDVARQEIEEATKKITSEINALNKFKSDLAFEIQNLDNRLVKIESIIQELQTAIIRKMGEYGEAVSSISQDLKETQKSFSKMINPLLDKKREIEENREHEAREESKEAQNKSKSKTTKPESKIQRDTNSASFEEYFR